MTDLEAVDVLVLGAGPAGRAAALEAAATGCSVAVTERRALDDHLFADGGAVATRTLRIAVERLVALGRRPDVEPLRIDDLLWPTRRLLVTEIEHNASVLREAGVELIRGTARFAGPHEVEVVTTAGLRRIWAERIILAVGTRAHHPAGVSLDGRTAVEPHEFLRLGIAPSTAVVVGGGLIGFEYASILGALSSYVVLLEQEDDVLPFIDRELAHALAQQVQAGGVELRLGARVTAVGAAADGRLVTLLETGDTITSRAVLWAADRHGATGELHLDLAALVADQRGCLEVDEHYRTAAGDVYAVGDVVRFPCLSADAAAQGRIAARHACGLEPASPQRRAPLVLWSIPALASAGLSEDELRATSQRYVVGRCSFSELVRGRLDAERGWLKLLAGSDGRLLGVHVIGPDAAELVHLGEAVMAAGATLQTLLASGYAYGSRAEAYRLAALDAIRQPAAA